MKSGPGSEDILVTLLQRHATNGQGPVQHTDFQSPYNWISNGAGDENFRFLVS